MEGFNCNIYHKLANIQYCSKYQTLTSSVITGIQVYEVTVRTISITVHLSNVLQTFLVVRVLVAIIILHASYGLFCWFYNLFRLKVCAVNCQCTTE